MSAMDNFSTRVGAPINRGLLIAATALLLFMTVLGPLMTYSELPLAGEGNPLRQTVYVGVLVAILIAVRPIGDWRRLTVVPIAIVVALAWCWLSINWAIDPGISARRITLTTVIIFSVFLASRHLGSATVLAMLRTATALVLLVNFAAVVFYPELGIHQANSPGDADLVGNWRGIMMHKNYAGAISALTVPLFVFDAERVDRRVKIAVIVGAIVFLVFSRSKTSLGLVGLGLVAGFAYQRYAPRWRGLAVLALLVLGSFLMASFQLYRAPMRDVMRDPSAFTGRVEIWRSLLRFADAHLWSGAGYGSFWNIGGASPIYSVAKGWVTDLTSAHNGFLDVTVQIGLPGLALVVIATIGWPFYRLIIATDLPGRRAAVVLAIIMFCISHNFTESSVFDRDQVVEVFLMFALALIEPIEIETLRARARRAGDLSFLGMRQALT